MLSNNISDIEASDDLVSGSATSNSNESTLSHEDEILETFPNMKIPSNKSAIENFQLEKFFDLDLSAKAFRTPDKALRCYIQGSTHHPVRVGRDSSFSRAHRVLIAPIKWYSQKSQFKKRSWRWKIKTLFWWYLFPLKARNVNQRMVSQWRNR